MAYYIRTAGISLIELILLMGIMLVIVTVILSSFIIFRRVSLLNSGTEIVVSALYRARSQTISSREASEYGVHVVQDRVVVFKGTTYISGNVGNSETLLPVGVEVSTTALNGGGADVVFNRLTGATNQYGSITLRAQGNSSTHTISLLQTGVISVQ